MRQYLAKHHINFNFGRIALNYLKIKKKERKKRRRQRKFGKCSEINLGTRQVNETVALKNSSYPEG